MNAGKHIVVAVRDETSGQIALQQALHTAQSPQDRFHIVHVSRTASWQRVSELLLQPAWMATGDEPDADRYGWLRRLAESPGTAGRVVGYEVLDGESGKGIVDFSRQVKADLIVVATPREGHARALFIGSTAMRILRTASCPVLVARGMAASGYTRALLAIDLDESGQRVARAATQWLSDAGIELVHSFRVPQEGQLRMHGHTEEEIAKLRAEMRAEVEERQGFVASVILEAAMRLRRRTGHRQRRPVHALPLLDGHHAGAMTAMRLSPGCMLAAVTDTTSSP